MKAYKFLTLVAVAAAAMLLASCQRMEQNIETSEDTTVARDADGHVLIPFSAETDSHETKAEMVGGNTTKIVYSEGDKLLVYSSGMNCPVLPSMMNLVGGVGTKKGTFKGDIVLREGKTESDFNTWITKYPDTLKAIIIPAAGLEEGLFTWDATKHDLSIDFTSGAISCYLTELVRHTVFFFGQVSYSEKKITDIEMATSYVKMDITVPIDRDWNTTSGEYAVTLTYGGDYHGIPFLTPTAKLVGTRGSTDQIWSGWANEATYEATGTFSVTSSTNGLLYMALLSEDYLRHYTDEYEAKDAQSFQLELENVHKGYSLYGKIAAFTIPHGKGFKKTVTFSDPSGEDVLTTQPESVRTAIMQSGDLNGDGRLTRYEAANYFISDKYNALKLQGNTDLTNANFLQFFTGLTSIPQQVFLGCTNLTTVCLPKNVELIDGRAFSDCTNLTTILWGESKLKGIQIEAFKNCTSLVSVTLPSTVTGMNQPFNGCTSLEFVDLNDTEIKNLLANCFQDCSGLKTINLPITLISIGDSCFSGCSSLASINLPNTLISIGDSCFSGCSSLASINLQNTAITEIPSSAFFNCSALTTVKLPSTLTSIGRSAFRFCDKLTSINLEATSLSTIERLTFEKCKVLASLTFPATLTSFVFTTSDNYPFQECTGLQTVRFLGTTPPVNFAAVMLKTPSIKKIYVPSSAVEAYKAEATSSFIDRIIGE